MRFPSQEVPDLSPTLMLSIASGRGKIISTKTIPLRMKKLITLITLVVFTINVNAQAIADNDAPKNTDENYELIMKKFERKVRYRNWASGIAVSSFGLTTGNIIRANQDTGTWRGLGIITAWGVFIATNTITVTNVIVRDYRVDAYHNKHKTIIDLK
jgi:hypothetical protein